MRAMTSTAAEPARASDILDARIRVNPYPTYRALREAARAHWLVPTEPRIMLLTRYEDGARALQDPALGHAETAQSAFRANRNEGVKSMLTANPPTHTRLRRLVSRAFTPGRVAAFAPTARALAVELVDAALERSRVDGEVDVVEDLARPLPLRIICGLLGVPVDDEKDFGVWASDLTRGLDPEVILSPQERAAKTTSTAAITAYLADLTARRRAEPGDDLLSELIAVQEAGDRLSLDELIDLGVLLLVAGYETTANLIGGAVQALARDPEQYALLRARPLELARPAVEEALRYDPSVHFALRTAVADAEVGGHQVRPGEGVLIMLAAAHRDDTVFAEADRFDVTRFAGPTAPPRHLSFGLGIHYCLGAPLARLETEILLAALAERVSRIELAAEPTYRPHLTIRGHATLPVRLTA
jgi:cytochrome P450